MFAFTTITITFQSIMLITNYVPESPMSLIEQGRLKEARDVLSMFNSPHVIDKVFLEYVTLSKKKNYEIRYRRKNK
jgi:hypothetical protein